LETTPGGSKTTLVGLGDHAKRLEEHTRGLGDHARGLGDHVKEPW
jgi:hypothetical protein